MRSYTVKTKKKTWKRLDLDQMISKSGRLDRRRINHTVIMIADGKEVDRLEYKY